MKTSSAGSGPHCIPDSLLIRPAKAAFQVSLIAFVYIAVSSFIGIVLLHHSYSSHAFDLGLFSQSLKSTLEGHLLYHSMGGLSHLAYHFSPVLLVLVPVYWIFPYVETLIVVQALLFGAGGYLVYCLCRTFELNHARSIMVEVLFFLNPLVWGVALFDFHPVVFAVPSLLLLFWGLKTGKGWAAITGLIFAISTKEDIIIATAAFAFVMMLYHYYKKRAVRPYILILAAAVIAYGVAIVTSAFASDSNFPRIMTYSTVRFEYLGSPPAEAIRGGLLTFFSVDSLFLVVAFLSPLLFLPLLSWQWSFAGLLVLLSNMLSTCPSQHSQLFQTATPAVPFLFMGFISSLAWIKEKVSVRVDILKKYRHIYLYFFISLCLISLVFISNGRIKEAGWPTEHDRAIDSVLDRIPDGVTVTANNYIFPHICTRTDSYLPCYYDPYTPIEQGKWGFPDLETEYVVVDSRYKQKEARGYWEDTVEDSLKRKYDLVFEMDGTRLFHLR
ncbi:MAG: DUF2079 domain-containing protein [Dehalococcoidales bacterium]|nr:DUF2079 domain-containing protein [Dehalococcoidales bacterium]